MQEETSRASLIGMRTLVEPDKTLGSSRNNYGSLESQLGTGRAVDRRRGEVS